LYQLEKNVHEPSSISLDMTALAIRPAIAQVKNTHFSVESQCFFNPKLNPQKLTAIVQNILQIIDQAALASESIQRPPITRIYRFAILEDHPFRVELRVHGSGVCGTIVFDQKLLEIDSTQLMQMECYLDYHGGFVKYVENQLHDQLDGLDFEIIECKEPKRTQPDDFWTTWVSTDHLAQIKYYCAIHPLFLDVVSAFAKPNAVMVDICSGTGDLAGKMFERLGDTIRSYILCERNKRSLKTSINKLRREIQEDRALVFDIDIEKQLLLLVLKAESADFVFASGALTYDVLSSKRICLDVLKQIVKILKPGGHLLVGGYSSSFLCAKDLEEVGLVVRNIWDPKHRRSFYIAEKPFPQPNYDLYRGGFIEMPDIREQHFPGQVVIEDDLPGFIKEEKPVSCEPPFRSPHRSSSLNIRAKPKQNRGWFGCCRGQEED
jgi:SAM-dependent methyltransferase